MSLVDALLAPITLLLLAPVVSSLVGRLLLLALPVGQPGTAPKRSVALPLALLEAMLAALAYRIALDLVGPELDSRSGGWVAQAFALAAAGLTLVAAARVEARREPDRATRPRVHLAWGAAFLLPLALALGFSVWPRTLVIFGALGGAVLALLVWHMRPRTRPRGEVAWAAVVLAFTLGAATWAAAAAVLETSAIATEAIATSSSARAHMRLRLEPWDGDAQLVLAWEARRTGHLDRAEALAERAVQLDADAASTLDFFAELSAARGDCEESYARFEGALRVRAAEAFEGVLDQPLQLGMSALPPTYITHCLAQNPADDAQRP